MVVRLTQLFWHSSKDYQKALLNDIDADLLPKFLGGTRTDPDGNPRCESIINYGGFVPTECYVIKKTMQSLVDQEGVLSIKVPRQDCRLIEIKVKEANSKVEWVFETPTKDIAVGFYLKKNDDSKDDMVELLQTERVFCHLVPESGAYICETPGTYVLKFDNSFSWISSKKVFYKIKLTAPGEADYVNEFE